MKTTEQKKHVTATKTNAIINRKGTFKHTKIGGSAWFCG